MFNANPSTTVCAACGRKNRASARFCVACDARLGAEPSIASAAPPSSARPPQVLHEPLLDGPLDSPRTVPARPAGPGPRDVDTGSPWVKLGLGGLVLVLGLAAWALYVKGNEAVHPVPAAQRTTAPEAAAVAAPPAVRSDADTPANAPVPAAVPDRPPARAAAAAPPRPARQAPPGPQAEVRARPSGAWVEPSRPPAMTSSPGYRDAGPPIVTEAAPTVSDGAPAASGGSARPADPGPPVVDGPGPRYDFSTPGARAR